MSAKSHQRSWFKRLFYSFLRVVSRLLTVALLEFRVSGREHFPVEGGGLILSTHQSVMDPVLVGLTCNRRMNYLARKTLFKNRFFSWLIRTLDAIEIDREGGGLMGLRETLIRLKRGELVLIFPEGTRTHNGTIGSLKPGFLAIARRANVPLIPVAIIGAYDVIPRGEKIPRRHPISVTIGKPILVPEIESSDDQALMSTLRDRLLDCESIARKINPVRCRGA